MDAHNWKPSPEDASLTSTYADDDSLSTKLSREAYVLGVGTLAGITDGFKEAATDPLGTGIKLASSVAVGLGLAYCQRGAGLMRTGAQLAGAAMGLSFVADVAAPGRWQEVQSVLADNWQSDDNLTANTDRISKSLGHFAFDTGLMMAGGAAGVGLGRHFFAQPLGVADVFKTLEIYSGRKWNGVTFEAYERAFQGFPHKAKGFVEAGKDSLVIELENGRMLKILKAPLPQDAGSRFFDLPIVESGRLEGGRISYLIQPKARVCTSKEEARSFARRVWEKGYNFWDMAPDQLGYYNGKLSLMDYYAVSKRSI